MVSSTLLALVLAATSAVAAPVHKRQAGQATFFQAGLGACGWHNSGSDKIVALTPSQYADGANCGKQIWITNPSTGRTQTATVADLCPTCEGSQDLDMSWGLFSALGGTRRQGVFQMNWGFVGEGSGHHSGGDHKNKQNKHDDNDDNDNDKSEKAAKGNNYGNDDNDDNDNNGKQQNQDSDNQSNSNNNGDGNSGNQRQQQQTSTQSSSSSPTSSRQSTQTSTRSPAKPSSQSQAPSRTISTTATAQATSNINAQKPVSEETEAKPMWWDQIIDYCGLETQPENPVSISASELYNHGEMTAACGEAVRLRNPANNKTVIATVVSWRPGAESNTIAIGDAYRALSDNYDAPYVESIQWGVVSSDN